MIFKLRPKQQEILTYRQGRLGISAVPGSGKTWTLSFLAADLLKRGILLEDQEILIVTLINSAVDNFYNRISSFVEARGLDPKYRLQGAHTSWFSTRYCSRAPRVARIGFKFSNYR